MVLLGFAVVSALAQVSTYTFSQTTGTYTAITGGTVHYSSDFDDGSVNVTLPFSFTFNSTAYSNIWVAANGYIVFGGSSDPTAGDWGSASVISQTLVTTGAIAGWAGDLSGWTGIVGGKTAEVRTETLGSSPNRSFVIQWISRPAYSTSTTTVAHISFQITLKETSNLVTIVYGPSGNLLGATNVSTAKQVGLRGATNADYNNRTNATTVSFNASTAGTSNSNTQAFSSVNATPGKPTSGLTYTWTPPAIPTCFAPSALQTSNILTTSATINWTAPAAAPASGYQWEVRTSGAGGSGATGLAASGSTAAGVTTANVTNLSSNTNYNLYVRSNCGAGDFSNWAGPTSFLTLTPPAIPPYFEGFTTTTTPAGWNTTGWTIGSVTGVGGNPGNSIYKNLFSVGTASGTFTTLNVGPITNGMLLSYDFKLANFASPYSPPAIGSGNFVVSISTDGGGNYTVVETIANNGVAGWQRKYTDLSTYAGSTIKIKIVGNWVSGDYYLAFDNFSIEMPPSCWVPLNLIVSNVTDVSASLSWAAPYVLPSNGYEWEIRTSGAPGSGSTGLARVGSTNLLTAEATGLLPVSNYSFYVRSSCGGTDFSTWAGPIAFTTQLCNIADKCNYSVTMTDVYGDGWDNTVLGFKQNGAVVGTFNLATGYGPQTVNIALCDDVLTEIVVVTLGSYTEEKGFVVRDPFNNLVYQRTPAAFTATTIFHTFTTECTLPDFQLLPEEYVFNDVQVGLPSLPKAFTFVNNLNAPVTVSSVTLTGGGASQFIKNDLNTYPKSLAAGASMTVNVVFEPTSPGEKMATIQIAESNGTHTIPISGVGYLNSPNNLTASPLAPFNVQLNWQAPLPLYEIKNDDNSVEAWYSLTPPSLALHRFYTKITIPDDGELTYISVLNRANAPVAWASVSLCSNNAGVPNLASPVESFSNVNVTSASGDWTLLQLTTPIEVNAGDTYYIVTAWPAASSVGPYVGTDMSSTSSGMCAYSINGGTAWTAFAGNFMMRAYMQNASKGFENIVLQSGSEVSALKTLPVKTLSVDQNFTIVNEDKKHFDQIEIPKGLAKIEPMSIFAPEIVATSAGENPKVAVTYTVKRGQAQGVYDTEFAGLTTTSFVDVSTQAGSEYYYLVAANYPNGQASSNEVGIKTATAPPYLEYFNPTATLIGWSQTSSLSSIWSFSETNLAGGEANEMKATFVSGTGVSRLISPPIYTNGVSQLNLSFKHFFDTYGTGINYKVQTSADGINWTDSGWGGASGTVNVGPETVNLYLGTNLGNLTYIAWVLDGNHYQFDYWHLDNVTISTPVVVTPSSQNLSCFESNDGTITIDITGGVSPYTLGWTGPNDFSSQSPVLTGLAAGDYAFTITDAIGNPGGGVITLTQPVAVPVPTVTNITAIYNGLTKTIVATAPEGTELLWFNAAEGGMPTTAPSSSQAGVYTAWAAAYDEVLGCESERIEATLTIQKKQLTINVSNASKCQNTPNPAFSLSYSGFIPGETQTNLPTQPTAGTTATLNSLPGTYSITISGGVSNNYAFVYVPGVLTVIPSPTVDAGPAGFVCILETFPITGASATNYTTIVWSTNGDGQFSNTGIINPVYTPGPLDKANGTALLTLTGDPGSTCAAVDHCVLTIQNDLPVSVSVELNTLELCVGAEASFSATPVNGGTNPSYQWKVNGQNAGTNNADFSYVPENGDLVTVVLSSSIGCALNNPATSDPFTVVVIPDLTAEVSIMASSTSVCDFTEVTFMATPVNGGMTPSYQWKVNGVNAGTNNANFTYVPLNNDEVTVVMTSSHLCATSPVGTSNTVTMTVAPPYLELFANPTKGGTVSGSGNFANGSEVTVIATPNAGWEFLNWKDADGTVLSTEAEYVHTIRYCYEAIYATFSSTAKIAGQLKYFNSNETVISSPNDFGVFYVQLFENGVPAFDRQLVKHNLENGLDSYYEFIGVESGKDYKLRVWEESANNLLGNTWTWNNWGGASSFDAYLIGYMTIQSPLLTSFPWILPSASAELTPYFSKVANVIQTNMLSNSDAYAVVNRVIGTSGYSPFPGGASNFQLATTQMTNHLESTYPVAPELLFNSYGVYGANSPAPGVYQEVTFANLSDGNNIFNIYFTATGDVNASYVPEESLKSSSVLAYEGVISAQKGEEVLIPVKLNKAAEFGAVTLGLRYNNQMIEVLDVEGFELFNLNHEVGTVKVAWFDQNGKSYASGESIVLLKARLLENISIGDRFIELLPITEFASVQASILSDISLSTPYIESGVTSVIDLDKLQLTHSSYPNPFKDVTQINYSLPESGKVSVIVYNYFGQEVKVLTQEVQTAGSHQLQLNNFDLRDAGNYFYRITLDGQNKTFSVRGTLVFVK